MAKHTWTGVALGAILLGLLGPAGRRLMGTLQQRADDATQRMCERDPGVAEWTKGYPYAAVVVMALVLVAAVVVAVVCLALPQVPVWGKAVLGVLLCVNLLGGFAQVLEATEYHAYPGADITTLNGSPCGVA
ncbi:hypothetical protein ACFVH6_19050 [Spirillospora sp. NPDC127200]